MDVPFLENELRHLHVKYNDLVDEVELHRRGHAAESVCKSLEAEAWETRKAAFRVLARLHDAGWLWTEQAGLPFGWSAGQVENKALRGWLLPKSEQTPFLASHHAPIGHEGVWHSKHPKLQLPAYIQNIRNALMRAGHGEAEAHAMAVAAVERWAQGKGAWGSKGKPTAAVQEAAKKAVAEWEELRRHHP